MEQVPRARARRRGAAVVNAARRAEPPHLRFKAAWEPAGVKAGGPAEVPTGVRAEDEVPDRAKVGGLNKSTTQPFK